MLLHDYEKINHKPQTPPVPKSCQSHQASFAPSLEEKTKKHIPKKNTTSLEGNEENHHFSLDMHINAVHVRDIRIFDQTLRWLQSFAVEFEMNDSLSIEFETPSCCIDHLDKSCTLRFAKSVNEYISWGQGRKKTYRPHFDLDVRVTFCL
jgi:hypothetical protein